MCRRTAPARHFRDIAGRVNQRPGGRGGCGLAGGLRHRRQNQITQSLADRASPRQGFCMQNLNTVLRAIPAPDADAMARAQQHIDGLLKPPGSLGRLEALAVQLAGMPGTGRPAAGGEKGLAGDVRRPWSVGRRGGDFAEGGHRHPRRQI